MFNSLMRIIGIISVVSQIDYSTNTWTKVIFSMLGFISYGLFVHIDSFQDGYAQALKDAIKVKTYNSGA